MDENFARFLLHPLNHLTHPTARTPTSIWQYEGRSIVKAIELELDRCTRRNTFWDIGLVPRYYVAIHSASLIVNSYGYKYINIGRLCGWLCGRLYGRPDGLSAPSAKSEPSIRKLSPRAISPLHSQKPITEESRATFPLHGQRPITNGRAL